MVLARQSRRLPEGALAEVGFGFGWKSDVFGVWAAPGCFKAIQGGGGLRSPPLQMVLKLPGAAQTPKRPIFSQIQNPPLLNPPPATADRVGFFLLTRHLDTRLGHRARWCGRGRSLAMPCSVELGFPPVELFKDPEIGHCRGLGGPGGPGNPSKWWGGLPPTTWSFPGPRGRPDPQND